MTTEADVQALLDRFEEIRTSADAGAVLGPASTSGEKTIIPLAEVSYAFEAATGSGMAPGAGAASPSLATGQGITNVRPVAVIELTSRSMRLRPVVDRQRIRRCRLLAGGWVALWLTAALVTLFKPRPPRP